MALSADRDTKRKDGSLGSFPVAVSKIYAGDIVMLNSSGYAIPGADTASCMFAGVATEQVDNSAGSAGDKRITVHRKGCFLFAIAAAAITDIGKAVYVEDGGGTVGLVGTTDNDIPCGKISEYEDATHVWVDIDKEIS